MGDTVVAGQSYGRLRAMFNFRGRKVRKAGPSTPVQILGLNDVPTAGEVFYVVPSERDARAIVGERKQEQQRQAVSAPKATLEELFTKFQAGEVKELRLIIKADVQGSLEPIMNALKEIEKGDINLNILQAEAGNVTDNDVMLAAASKAIIVGFSVQADTTARRLAEAEGVSIRLYDIIYRLTEDIEKALKGMLAPEFKEILIGRAEIKAIFRISKVGAIVGCRVTSGEIRRNGRIRILRNNEKIYEGELASLKHERDDVREVRQGFDCGMGFKNFNDFAEGDVIECFTLERFGG
jgi:translation initiation factor IF-2